MKKFVKLDFSVSEVDTTNNFAKFEVKPLVQGFAGTLGNALRRTLLSSLLGSSIYAFKIKGIEQEFQNLEGSLENVVKIGLNLRKIIFKVDSEIFAENKSITVLLKGTGKKTLKAKDIELPTGIEIINPEAEILTITDESKTIEMELFIIQGRGFSNFENNKSLLSNSDIGKIAISSNFSPVTKVGMQIEEIKIGEREVLENLVLSITTNGAIDPVISLAQASKILISHFNYFVDFNQEQTPDFVFVEKEAEKNEFEKIELTNLDFSERTSNALDSQNIRYLGDLQKMKRSDLLNIKNLGQKSLKEIVEKLWNDYKIKLEE